MEAMKVMVSEVEAEEYVRILYDDGIEAYIVPVGDEYEVRWNTYA